MTGELGRKKLQSTDNYVYCKSRTLPVSTWPTGRMIHPPKFTQTGTRLNSGGYRALLIIKNGPDWCNTFLDRERRAHKVLQVTSDKWMVAILFYLEMGHVGCHFKTRGWHLKVNTNNSTTNHKHLLSICADARHTKAAIGSSHCIDFDFILNCPPLLLSHVRKLGPRFRVTWPQVCVIAFARHRCVSSRETTSVVVPLPSLPVPDRLSWHGWQNTLCKVLYSARSSGFLRR